MEVVAEAEYEASSRRRDAPVEVTFVDLDGDGATEIVVVWSLPGGVCRCDMRGAVLRRSGAGYETVYSTSGQVEVVNLPRGLRGVLHYPNDDDSALSILLLRPGASAMTPIFRREYGQPAETTCVSDDGSEYQPEVRGAPFYVELGGVRVLEEIREESGCEEGDPPIRVLRIEDLLRRARLLPAE
jgi:hypothetical protein